MMTMTEVGGVKELFWGGGVWVKVRTDATKLLE